MSEMSPSEALEYFNRFIENMPRKYAIALAVLRKAVDVAQSRHDYGPASPGEQEAAWQLYCGGIGWDHTAHPAAKNAFVEGFCLGDSFSQGDEGRATLRAEVKALEEQVKLAREANAAALQERVAQLLAHRACHGAEHDPLNGKIHGYCVVCGVPWPCEAAKLAPAEQEKG